MFSLFEDDAPEGAKRVTGLPEKDSIMVNFGNISYRRRRAAALAMNWRAPRTAMPRTATMPTTTRCSRTSTRSSSSAC